MILGLKGHQRINNWFNAFSSWPKTPRPRGWIHRKRRTGCGGFPWVTLWRQQSPRHRRARYEASCFALSPHAFLTVLMGNAGDGVFWWVYISNVPFRHPWAQTTKQTVWGRRERRAWHPQPAPSQQLNPRAEHRQDKLQIIKVLFKL